MAGVPRRGDFIESCIMCGYLYRSAEEQKFYCKKLKHIHVVPEFPFRDRGCKHFKYLFEFSEEERENSLGKCQAPQRRNRKNER